MSGLYLRLCGIPVSIRDEHADELSIGAKDLGLLAFLVLEPGPHPREQLASLLWGDSKDSQARASLRQALRRLKQTLGDRIEVTRTTVQLTDPPECDVVQLLASAGSDPEAVAGFDATACLTGLTVRRAPAFEDWADGVRARVRRCYRDALSELARDRMLRWRWREAVGWAERWVAAEPLAEEAGRVLGEALYLGGERARALRELHALSDRLRGAGLEPGPPLNDLVTRIEQDRGAVPLKPISAEWLARGPQLDSGLIGREDQWDALVDAWQGLRRGHGQALLIEGEAGVGKTRLAEEFLRWAGAEGATVLHGRGYDPRDGTPFGPVVEAMRGGLNAPGLAGADPEWLSEASRLLPELRRIFSGLAEPPVEADAAGRWRLFEGLAQVVLALAVERPVLVLIDDLQWCDSETCALLHFLIRRWSVGPVLVLATVTLGELERDAPASRLLRAMRTQAHASVITVGPLDESRVRSLIQEMGHLRDPAGGQRFARRVYEVTGGNPFYIVELLKTLFAQGLLAVDETTGVWKPGPEVNLDSSRPIPMPRTVQDAIAERVAHLPIELRDLFATIVIAGSCQTELLSRVHGISRLHVAALCDELVGRRLVAETGGVYRAAHSLIAKVVHDDCTVSRRREIHRSIALALEQMAASEGVEQVAGRIARHAEHAGEHDLAYKWALVASHGALVRYALEEAMSWVDLAAAVAATPDEADEVNRLTAHLLELAGWTEPPHAATRRSFAGSVLATGDLDFQG